MDPKHPRDNELRQYSSGKLSGAVWDSIDAHVSSCRECQDRVESLSIDEDRFLRGLKRGAGNELEAGQFLATQSRFTPHFGTIDSIPSLSEAGSGQDVNPPEQIGRYRVERLLGEGGFGRVYLAQDTELNRRVAVKVPTRHWLSPQAVDSYRKEARTIAQLDHPNIVPVYDSGSTETFPVYIVSKYIEGCDLRIILEQGTPELATVGQVVSALAEALQHAHQKGLVHRDIKPANILLDDERTPYLVDFGLALREQELGQGSGYCGTPGYMSPEQSRGEGHRVDGRSDIFSLGIVLYELLVGQRPFVGDTQTELLEQIATRDPKPPRQFNDKIPKEVERICLRALAKRAVDRYSAARDMADDLRLFLDTSRQTTLPSEPSGADRSLANVDRGPVSIVPKGLRAFDEHDAEFFPSLLPGPCDRDGLPDSLHFWKTQVEEFDSETTFSVGLIYGPSGCGKSSFVKAGLLPRLNDCVIPVYVEATAADIESRLLRAIRKRCSDFPSEYRLTQVLTAIRQGQGIPAGKKLLIVLDQFEQWLHAQDVASSPELVDVLRQCDGGRVQSVLMIRDDFWMAVTRLMRAVEVPLVEGKNSSSVDLFPMRHAEAVLVSFGRALGALPDDHKELGLEEQQFVEQAVAGLAENGNVVCLRLALFAEMMKGRRWTARTLTEVGGATGIGVTFLEETFRSRTAPPGHRYHQRAARALLAALLPESGSDIKGEMKSVHELKEVSGYSGQDFEDLIKILDSETRLITPTELTTDDAYAHSAFHAKPGEQYYQLTHDYLVPSLREWLARRQKATRRGRAELLLAERASLWSAKRERRHLPSFLEWIRIRVLTPKKAWSTLQSSMMVHATRLHATRLSFVIVILLGSILSLTSYRSILRREIHLEDAANAYAQWDQFDLDEARRLLDECPEDLREWEWHFVNRLCQPVLSLRGTAAVVSPEGRQIAIEGFGDYAGTGEVTIWDLASAKSGPPLVGSIDSLGFSPDGKWFATERADRSVTIWNAKTGTEQFTVPNGEAVDYLKLYSADSRRALFRKGAGSFLQRRFEIEVWDIADAERHPLRSLDGKSLIFSSSGDRIALQSAETTTILDARNLRTLGTLRGKPVAFSPDEQRAATIGDERGTTIQIWDIASEACQIRISVPTHPQAVVFSEDGGYVAALIAKSSSSQAVAALFDSLSGERLHQFPVGMISRLNDHLVVGPHGNYLAVVSGGPFKTLRDVRIYETETGGLFHEFKYPGRKADIFAAATPDGRRLVRPTFTPTAIEIVDLVRGETDQVLRVRDRVDSTFFAGSGDFVISLSNKPHKNSATENSVLSITVLDSDQDIAAGVLPGALTVAVSPDAELVATAVGHKAVVYGTNDLRQVFSADKHTGDVTSVAFSRSGKWLATASQDKTVTIWDTQTGECVRTLTGHTDRVDSVAFDPTGTLLASAGADRIVRLWDAQRGNLVRELPASMRLGKVLFSPDGNRVAAAYADLPIVRIWSSATGEAEMSVQVGGEENTVNDIAFSPSGRQISGACQDGTVRIWDADSGTEIGLLGEGPEAVGCVAFSPNGDRIAAGMEYGSLALWNVTAAERVLEFPAHGSNHGITGVTFSPRGRWIVTVGQDHRVRLWDSGKEWHPDP